MDLTKLGLKKYVKPVVDTVSTALVVADKSAMAESESVQSATSAVVPATAKDSFGPANFQDVLGRLDTLVGESTGINTLQMDEARGYVMKIMTTLKTHPEFDGLLAAKDVHNVMVFIQSSSQLATADFIVKKEKKATSAAKKAKAVGNMTFEMPGFEGSIGGAAPEHGGMTFSMDAFATLNVDEIAPVDKKVFKKS